MTLTCAACARPLYPHLARRTEEGFVHTKCPRQLAVGTKACVRCGITSRYRLCRDCSEVTKTLGEHARWAA